MCRFSGLSLNYERRSEISSDEIDDLDTETEGDLPTKDVWEENYDEDEDEYWDDEPEEREYCD